MCVLPIATTKTFMNDALNESRLTNSTLMKRFVGRSGVLIQQTGYFFGPRGGVTGRPEFKPPYWYLAFFSEGFKI